MEELVVVVGRGRNTALFIRLAAGQNIVKSRPLVQPIKLREITNSRAQIKK